MRVEEVLTSKRAALEPIALAYMRDEIDTDEYISQAHDVLAAPSAAESCRMGYDPILRGKWLRYVKQLVAGGLRVEPAIRAANARFQLDWTRSVYDYWRLR